MHSDRVGSREAALAEISAHPPYRSEDLAVISAWQPARTRDALTALFSLDTLLRGTIARAREPILAQMRLAWWRERLREPADRRPIGEPLIEAIGRTWSGAEEGLVRLIDGWEALLAAAPLGRETISVFADGRGQAISGFARLCGNVGTGAVFAGRRWALAEFATGSRHPSDRAAAIEIARKLPETPILPRSLRGVAVLNALAARALDRGEPMLAGRGAALVAMRVGMFGR